MDGKINMYLDDLRDCPEGFTVARTVEDAIRLFSEHEIHILSLDNDMGMRENGTLHLAGSDLVNHICEHGLRADKIYIHTDNSVERGYMYRGLLAAQRRGFIDSDIEIYDYPIVPNRYTEKLNYEEENQNE